MQHVYRLTFSILTSSVVTDVFIIYIYVKKSTPSFSSKMYLLVHDKKKSSGPYQVIKLSKYNSVVLNQNILSSVSSSWGDKLALAQNLR